MTDKIKGILTDVSKDVPLSFEETHERKDEGFSYQCNGLLFY